MSWVSRELPVQLLCEERRLPEPLKGANPNMEADLIQWTLLIQHLLTWKCGDDLHKEVQEVFFPSLYLA